ncbi:MAG: HEAT repeat domain-containing protein [Candidatus Aminicenantes bacterium]|nr:HEAT repeat domain-containing protein [Candidatus Aminicenantes bacterium]
MEEKLVQDIIERLKEKSTEELSQILEKHDLSEWSEDAFEAIRQILPKRDETRIQIQDLENKKDLDGLVGIITSIDSLDCSNNERKEAARALKKINDLESTEALIRIGNNSSMDKSIRSYAIRAIGEIGSTQAVDHLTPLIEDLDKTIRDAAQEALTRIDHPVAKRAIEIENCQVCRESFPLGREKKSLCPECLKFNKIEGWLAYFIIVTLISSAVSFYNFHALSQQSFENSLVNLMEIVFLVFAILLLVGFFLLIGKVPIARFYMLLISGSNIIALVLLIVKASYRINVDSLITLPLLNSFIYFGYFLRSKRVKVVYKT